jgi:hypothetical protein
MSTLPGNPLVGHIIGGIDVLSEWMEREGETDATMIAVALDRQAEATLALAFEQRTATLLQLAIHQDRAGKIGDAYFEQVASRLGLDGDES